MDLISLMKYSRFRTGLSNNNLDWKEKLTGIRHWLKTIFYVDKHRNDEEIKNIAFNRIVDWIWMDNISRKKPKYV